MTNPARKVIGFAIILVFMIFYALVVMTIAVAKLQGAPHWIQAVYFLVAGTLWGVPLFPLIRWMQRPNDA